MSFNKQTITRGALCLLIVVLSACGGGSDGAAGAPGLPGTNAVVRSSVEPASANCAAGGARIDSGLDANANGVLEDSEVTTTAFACNGLAGAAGTPGTPGGAASLVRTASEPAGANCTAGGVRIQIGVDSNSDGQLQDNEVQLTNYACNGTAGQSGPAGPAGPAGPIGLSSLVRTTPEAPGLNCPAGGLLIQVGLDANANGTLDAAEISSSAFGCNGVPGAPGAPGEPGLNSLIRTSAEPAGVNCAAGGLRVQVGLDTNRDSVLQPTEVTSTDFVCSVAAATSKSWQLAQLLETDDAGAADEPQIAIDGSGNALAVWRQSDGTRFNIWANRYTAGTGWGTAALIETDNTGGASRPQIAINADGNAIAVWAQLQASGATFNILANRFTPAGGWGTATLIETDNAGGALNPQIAINADGNAIAVWEQFDGRRTNIWANRFTPAGGWGTAALIETDDAGAASQPEIAIEANGNAIAVWTQSDGIRNNILANRFTPAGGWGTAALIETDDAGNASRPQIAIEANGNAIAVWTQFDGATFNILANHFTPAGGWGTATLIETDNTGGAFGPQIAIDANGNALAVWHQSDGTRTNIWANSFR